MKRILALIVVMICSMLSVNAAEDKNILQSIQIDALKDTYNIIFVSDTEPKCKKEITASNKMTVHLKGVSAANTVNTIYNGTTNVDTIMVEPEGENQLKVYIQAPNIENAAITFDSLNKSLIDLKNQNKTSDTKIENQVKVKEETKTEQKDNSIVLSDPIRNYAPVYEEDAVEEDFSDAFHVGGLIETLKNDKINTGITFILISVIIFCGRRLMKKTENNSIGSLAQQLNEREMALHTQPQQAETAFRQRSPISGMTSDLSIRKPAMQSPYLNPTQSYGLKAYQNGNKNPYMTSEVRRPSTPIKPQAPIQQSLNTISSRNNSNVIVNPNSSNPIQRQALQNTLNQKTLKPSNIDSMKFLESMTKIYEKNGRSDLAQGLKSSMSKARAKTF